MIKNIINNNYEILVLDNFIHIKNYISICNVNSNNMEIVLKNKKLKIKGNNLIVCKLDRYEISIRGNILLMEYINE